MKYPFSPPNSTRRTTYRSPTSITKLPPNQSWLNPNPTDPIYPIKHAPGSSKGSYQLLYQASTVVLHVKINLTRLLCLVRASQLTKIIHSHGYKRVTKGIVQYIQFSGPALKLEKVEYPAMVAEWSRLLPHSSIYGSC